MRNFDSFAGMALSPSIIEALQRLGITTPTAVQAQAIMPMLDWYDIIAKAPTGTGKTIAFGIPILEHLNEKVKEPQALVLAPTRELALQISSDLSDLAHFSPWQSNIAVYGGQAISKQLESLNTKNPRIIVATPGRLLDLYKRRELSFKSIETVVLDEADRMLDMGFLPDVKYILDLLTHVSQVAMFSATLSRSVMDISWVYQRDPREIEVSAEAEDQPQIEEFFIHANGGERLEAMMALSTIHQYRHVILFVNRKQTADIIQRKCESLGLLANALHGDLSQAARERVLTRFRNKEVKVLIATDVAARGLDIDHIDAVFNYDLPDDNENYIHRIGRTGRARRQGAAYSFVAPSQDVRWLELARVSKSNPVELNLEDILAQANIS